MVALPSLESVGARLKYAREMIPGRPQSLLAEACGVSNQAVSGWERTDKVDPDRLITAAELYGVPFMWLYKGGAGYTTEDSKANGSRVAVPIISNVQAGLWTPATDPFEYGAWDSQIYPDVQVSDSTFGLRIVGSSMEPRFQEGDCVIVDPRVQPLPGDFVVAKLDRDDEATFKKYRPRGIAPNGEPLVELQPLNEDWPTLWLSPESPGRIVGTMVEHRRYRRKWGREAP